MCVLVRMSGRIRGFIRSNDKRMEFHIFTGNKFEHTASHTKPHNLALAGPFENISCSKESPTREEKAKCFQ